MKIIIQGCGAMGSVYAGLLAEAGNDVWAVDTWTAHVDAIRAKGLRVEGFSGDRTVAGVRATTDIAEAMRDGGPAELVVLATKADGVRAAAAALAPCLGGETAVLAMQNGIGAVDILRESLPDEAILLGIAKGFGASVPEPGRAHHHAMAEVRVGELGGGESARGRRIAEVWSAAGFNAHFYPDIDRLVWEKFVCNVTLSASCTVFDVTVRELRAREDLWKIALGCGLEAHAVGVAKGVRFGFDDPVDFITAYTDGVLDARPSMDHDHKARRKSEIDFINGRVPVLGADVGVPTPYNDSLSAVIRDRERSFS
jgi:2-dehydropantoate 2-reductase